MKLCIYISNRLNFGEFNHAPFFIKKIVEIFKCIRSNDIIIQPYQKLSF